MDAGDYLRIALLVVAAPLLVTLVSAARLRLRRSRRTRARWEEVTDELRTTVAEAALALEQHGFVLVGPVWLEPPEVTDDDRDVVFQLHDAEQRTYAYLRVYGARRQRPVSVTLESFDDAGGRPVLLLTEGAHTVPALAASTRLEVVSAPDASDVPTLVARHRAATASRQLLRVEPDDALALSDQGHGAWIDEGLANGRLVADGESVRFSLLGALRVAAWLRFRSGVVRAMNAETQRGAVEQPPDAELEARNHVRLESVERRPMPRPLALVLFVLGAGLSALWFSSSDPVLGLALLGVVFVHELGHAIAMRLLGYGDTRIYFIPGFGGAAVGQKRDASIHVEGVVLLAGPLPGLFVGLVLALGLTQLPTAPEWEPVREPLFAVALAAILVNYVNLLPAMPLDGGRLAQRITSGIHPFLDVAFRVFSIALLGLGAIAMGDFLFGMLAVVLALQTPATYRAAVLESALRARGASEWSEKQRLVEIYRGATVRGAVARRALATQVALRLAAPPSPLWSRALWAAIYVLVLVAPLAFAFTALIALVVANLP